MGEEDKPEATSTTLTSQQERRAHERFVVDERAVVLVVGHGMSFPGRVLDLSLSGCRIQAKTHLPGGGRVRVEVTFTVNGLPFRIGGAIRWSSGEDLGIQFVRVSPVRQAEWAKVITELDAIASQAAYEAAEVATRKSSPVLLPSRDAELIQIVDANLVEAARRAGSWLVCRINCTQCCHGSFAINALDAQRLRVGMEKLRTAEPAIAEAIQVRAHNWIAEFGIDFPGDRKTGILGTTDEERGRFEDFANEAACPALDPATGRCDVYTWRPMTCRVFGPPVRSASEDGEEGLGHCELCFEGASAEEIAKCEMPVPSELEAEVLGETGLSGETVVAFALVQ